MVVSFHPIITEKVYKKSHDSSKSITWISDRYARFMRLKLGDAAGARTTLESALAEDDRNPNLFLQLLDIALHEHPLKADAVVALLDNAMEKVGWNQNVGVGLTCILHVPHQTMGLGT